MGKILQHSSPALLSKINSIPLSFKIGGLIDIGKLSHSPAVKEQYLKDPHNHLKLHSKFLLNMVISSHQTFSRPLHPLCPAFVTIGTEDKIVCVESLKNYFQYVEKDFHLQLFEGAWHEIHNETNKYRMPYFDFLRTSLIDILHKF